MFKSGILFIKFMKHRFTKELKYRFYILGVATAIMNIMILLLPLLQKKMIDSISDSYLDYKIITLLLLIGIGIVVISIYEAIILNKLNISMQNRLHKELISSAMQHSNKIIETRGAGAYLMNVFGDSEQICGLLNTNYFTLVLTIISSIAILFITTKWTWIFTIVIIPTYFIMCSILYITNKLYIKQFQKFRELVFEINPEAQEFLENRKTVVGYADVSAYEKKLYDKFELRDNYLQSANKMNYISKSILDTIKQISMIIFFILCMIEIQSKGMELSAFIAMIGYFPQVFLPIMAIQNANTGMNKFKTLHEKIKNHLDLPPKLALPEHNTLHVTNCSFSYGNEPDGNSKSISQLNINIDKKIGLVGLSGEGKTTIIKIILGELHPQTGQCLLGNRNTMDIPKSIIYSSIRWYSQEPELFDKDLEFNITFGKTPLDREHYYQQQLNCREQIINLLNKIAEHPRPSLVKDEIDILKTLFLINKEDLHNPLLLNNLKTALTNVSKENIYNLASILVSKKYYILEKYKELLERLNITSLAGRNLGQRGSNISGGEKNRICLARFLLPDHNGFFIIDEPFISLDLLAEKQCLEVLKDYIKDYKGIIISHKLNVIQELSEEILILEQGKITGQGSHNKLLQENQLYQNLYQTYMES